MKKIVKIEQGGIYDCDIDISVEEWKEILQDKQFGNYIDTLIKFYQESNHKSTCKALGEKYNESPAHFNAKIIAFAKAVQKKLARFEVVDAEGNPTYWIIPMKGRYLPNNLFEWTLRNELVEAIRKLDLFNNFNTLKKYNVNYWHIQMNQPWGRDKGKIDSALMLKKETPIIGTGEWDDIQCEYFKNTNGKGLKKNDVILIREGIIPIALAQIKSDYFEDEFLENEFHHQFYRKVRVFEFFNNTIEKLLNQSLEKYKTTYIQASGTLTKCKGNNATNYFIKLWHKKILSNMSNVELTELLQYKKQIILQGPPGTGKTRLAKELAGELVGTVKNKIDFSVLNVGEELPTPTERSNFQILDVNYDKSNVRIKPFNSKNEYTVPFYNIEDCIVQEGWNHSVQEWDFSGMGPYLISLAHTIVRRSAHTIKDKQIKIIQFHPSYTYEDFVRGIVAKPNENGEGIIYEAENKMLADFAKKAFLNNKENFVLIIDEINRANLSSVLGELIYALEYRYYFGDDKQKQKEAEVESLYAVKESEDDEVESRILRLPENLYIIGTMNTADRSVGHIDYAIRRRFAFVDVLPKLLPDDDEIFFNTDGFNKVTELFKSNVSPEFEAKDVQIGHSYFIASKKDTKDESERDKIFKMKMNYEAIPILLEYVKDGVLIGQFDNKEIKEHILTLKVE